MKTPKVVLLFGAGASYGCGGIENPPPLGSNLYHELIKEYPESWGSIPDEFASLFKSNFEEGMSSYYDHTKNIAGILKDLSIFFSKFRIDDYEKNLYWKLGKQYHSGLLKEEILLATINYDCLLELGISPLINELNYWGESEGIRILKIHGSCNFIKTGVKGQGTLILNGIIHGPLAKVRPQDVINIMMNTPLPAAMSLYAKSKDILISPSIILGILDDFQRAIAQSKHVIVVGIRPNILDTHIWEHLESMDGTLHLVGNEHDCNDWMENYRKEKECEYISNRFSISYSRICEIIDDTLY